MFSLMLLMSTLSFANSLFCLCSKVSTGDLLHALLPKLFGLCHGVPFRNPGLPEHLPDCAGLSREFVAFVAVCPESALFLQLLVMAQGLPISRT